MNIREGIAGKGRLLGHTRRGRLVAALLLGSLVASEDAVAVEPAWAADIHVFMLREADGAQRALARTEVEFAQEEMAAGPEVRIDGWLRNLGFHPDAEAFGVVYTLNPALDPIAIETGQRLVMPRVTGSPAFRQAREEGYLLALTLDVGLKRTILAQAREIRSLANRIGFFEPPRSGTGDAGDRVKAAMLECVSFLDAVSVIIRERTRPLASEMLWQTTREAEVLRAVLHALAVENRAVNPADEELVSLIAEEMHLRAGHLRGARGPGEPPPRFSQASVVVRALRGRDRAEVHGLRVYYVPVALRETEGAAQTFLAVTSPADKWLPIANYFMWAAEPGDPTPVSDVVKVQVRLTPGGAALPVDLVVPQTR